MFHICLYEESCLLVSCLLSPKYYGSTIKLMSPFGFVTKISKKVILSRFDVNTGTRLQRLAICFTLFARIVGRLTFGAVV